MQALRKLSIRNKLMASMAACLLLFAAISTVLGFVLTGASLRERVVGLELPAVVGEIRNDILRQISAPLAMAQGLAANSFLLTGRRPACPTTPPPHGRNTRAPSSSRPARPACSGCPRPRAATTPTRGWTAPSRPVTRATSGSTTWWAAARPTCCRSTRT